MAIRNLQASVSAANRLNLTGIVGEAVESGYYVLGNNYTDFSHIDPYSSGYASSHSSYMCNKNIDTFPDGIKKVGLWRNRCMYVLTSGNDLYAMGEFHRGDNTEAKKYYDFTYVTGNVLDAFVSAPTTVIIDTGNTMFICGENQQYAFQMHDALPSTGNVQDSIVLSTKFRTMPGSWTSINGHGHNPTISLVGQQTDGKIYIWGRLLTPTISSPSGTSISDWTDYFLGADFSVIAKRSNGDLYGFGSPNHVVDSANSNGDSCNRLGIGKAFGTNFAYSFQIASVFNNLNKNFTKVSIGERNAALLTDDKALYVVGENYASVLSNNANFGYDFTDSPALLYSGIDDVCLELPTETVLHSLAMIFISGGNLYGLGQANHLHHYNPDNDLSNLGYHRLNDPDATYIATGQLIYNEPILIETGNWKYCFINDGHRLVWNDTELGIGGRCQATEIIPKSIRNNSYKDTTFIPGVDASIFENIEFRTHMALDNFDTRGYCAYLSGNEFYVWGRNNNSSLVCTPDSGNYDIFPDTLPTDEYVNVGSNIRRAGLMSLVPKKVDGVWDKAFVYSNAVFLTINNSGYFFGNASNSNKPLGDAISYSSNLKVRFESGIMSDVTLNSGYVYPPEYLGYNILDVIWANNYCILLTTDNELYGCGYNKQGQLGIGNTTHQNTFQNLSGLNGSGIVKIFGGQTSLPSLALSSGGNLYTWGNGEKGLGYTLTAGDIALLDTNVNDVFVGGGPHDVFPLSSRCIYYIKNSGELYSLTPDYSNYKGQGLTGDTTGRDTYTRIGLDSDWAEIVHPLCISNLARDDTDFYHLAHDHVVLARKTDNSIYIATDDKFNNMNSGFESLSTTDGLIVPGQSTPFLAWYNSFRPINLTQYSGIYASRIIGHSDGFILIPTG